MKRTVLMLASDEFSDYGKTRLDYNIRTIQSYISDFNTYGYRVLLSTDQGSQLLDFSSYSENDINTPNFNFPIPIEKLGEQDFQAFCCLYILASREISWNDLISAKTISSALPHFIETGKIVAVQSPSTQCVLYPPIEEENIFCPQLEKNGLAKPGISPMEFSHSVMNLIALRDIP